MLSVSQVSVGSGEGQTWDIVGARTSHPNVWGGGRMPERHPLARAVESHIAG